jgi:alanine racemase
MDNVTLDVGAPAQAAVGDGAILVGEQGGERITAEELALRLDTINYEITCGLLPRVPRAYHRDGEALA